MPDLFGEWHQDLRHTLSGDLALADTVDLPRQRILRRLLTPIRGYLWHLEYGAGLPQKIGHLAVTANIEALIRANIALEASVVSSPPPKIKVTGFVTGLYVIEITYVEAILGEQVTLSFDTTGQILDPALLLG